MIEKEASVKLNREETLALLHNNSWMENRDKWNVQSLWLCDRLNEYEKSGFVYNTEAMRKIEQEEGLPRFDDNGSVLSILVYNAQRYRRSDRLKADGWKPLTPELVREAIATKKRVEILGENIIGGETRQLCKPVQRGDVFAAMKPRAKTCGFIADGTRLARLA